MKKQDKKIHSAPPSVFSAGRGDSRKDELFERIEMVSQSHALSVANPFNVVYEYDKGPCKELKGDVHYALQITFVLYGKVEAVVGDVSRIYHKGELWWTMCWEPHAYRPVAARNLMLSVNISVDSLGNCGPYADADWLAPFTVPPQSRYLPSTDKEKQEVLAVAQKLMVLSKEKLFNWQTRCWLLIHDFILTAMEHVSRTSVAGTGAGTGTGTGTGTGGAGESGLLNANISRIMKAVTLIRTLPVPLPLEEAAEACSLSVSRFSFLFRSVMGVSYGQFALRVRLANAANDIKSGLYTLNEIAFKYGFCDASSLCNAFKKVYRCTPAQFKHRK